MNNAFALLLALAAVAAVASAAVAPRNVAEDCWDTGCQLNSWAVKGCEQYGRYAKKQRPCPGGIIYTCCTRGYAQDEEDDGPTVLAQPKCKGTVKCLEKTSLPVAGCKAVSKKVVKKLKEKPCEKGWVYSCCANYEVQEGDGDADREPAAEGISHGAAEAVEQERIIEQ